MRRRTGRAEILVGCECGHLQPQWNLYFCVSCSSLKCRFCIREEVDSYFCPGCLENITSSTATKQKNRCSKCFECPRCQSQLTYSQSLGDDRVYLKCPLCRWNSLSALRDVQVMVDPLPPFLKGKSSLEEGVSLLDDQPLLSIETTTKPKEEETKQEPCGYALSPEDVALRNVLREKEMDKAQNVISGIIEEMHEQSDLLDPPFSSTSKSSSKPLVPSFVHPLASGSGATLQTSLSSSFSSRLIAKEDPEELPPALAHLENSKKILQDESLFKSKSVTRGKHLDGINSFPSEEDPLPPGVHDDRQQILSLCREEIAIENGVMKLSEIPLHRKTLRSRRSKRCGTCDKVIVKPTLNSLEFQRQHCACYFIPVFSVAKWERTSAGTDEAMELQLRVTNLREASVTVSLKSLQIEQHLQVPDLVKTQILKVPWIKYQLQRNSAIKSSASSDDGTLEGSPSTRTQIVDADNALIRVYFSATDWSAHSHLSLSFECNFDCGEYSSVFPVQILLQHQSQPETASSFSKRPSSAFSSLTTLKGLFDPDGDEIGQVV